MIKPDGVKRGLVGEIIGRFEERGFRILALKMLIMTKSLAEEFYSPHARKPFFRELVDFITSGPVVAAVLEGASAVGVTRRMIGSTNSREAEPGTIRGDFGLGVTDNVIHAADSPESFARESKLLFPDIGAPSETTRA